MCFSPSSSPGTLLMCPPRNGDRKLCRRPLFAFLCFPSPDLPTLPNMISSNLNPHNRKSVPRNPGTPPLPLFICFPFRALSFMFPPPSQPRFHLHSPPPPPHTPVSTPGPHFPYKGNVESVFGSRSLILVFYSSFPVPLFFPWRFPPLLVSGFPQLDPFCFNCPLSALRFFRFVLLLFFTYRSNRHGPSTSPPPP